MSFRTVTLDHYISDYVVSASDLVGLLNKLSEKWQVPLERIVVSIPDTEEGCGLYFQTTRIKTEEELKAEG